MQDIAKAQLKKQRENTYIHKQRLSAMCTCTHKHIHTKTDVHTQTSIG